MSKKGPYGTIWVAAQCHKKLKKDQVTHTNISASVDKILIDGVPAITYRILAYLLLGVVRIYSKKVEYLFHDCRNVLTKICQFASRKQTSSNLGGMCAPPSTRKRRATLTVEAICAPYSAITLPERFELDSFDLGLLEDARGDHVKSREDIMLDDSWEDGRSGRHSLDKDRFGEDTALSEDHYEAFTLPTEFRRNSSPDSMEKLRDNIRFSLEERLDPMILGEGEEESDFGRPFDKEHETGGDHLKETTIPEESAGPPGQSSSFYDMQHRIEEKEMLSEMNSAGIEKLQVTPEPHPVSITIDVTPASKMPNILDAGATSKVGAATPQSMAVRTPAPKEHRRLSRKRQCIFDEIVVVPNNVLKGWIDDWSDLICKRRKVPHTAKQVWRAHRISNLRQSFLEPLIPIVPIDFRSLTCKKKLETPEPAEARETPAESDGLEPMETRETPAKTDGLRSPAHGFREEEAIAPSTPVTHSTSVRFSEIRVTSKSYDAGPASSFESIGKDLSPSGNGELDKVLMDEEELNSNEGNSQENHKWSARTRTVAGHLHKNFVHRRKRGKEEALSLFQVLKGKTKKESARLFYELLVLKSGQYVDVKQNKAYDDIFVMECSKLKEACEADRS